MVYQVQVEKKGQGKELVQVPVFGVTVVIPTLNEERNIADVIGELKRIGFLDILVIDGNSKDETARIARELGVNLIFQNGHGKGTALRQVFSYGGLKGNIVVMMDADGSMDPKELFSFVEALKPEVDVAKGSRFIHGGYSEDMTFPRKVGNLLFVALSNLLMHTKYTDLCYGFAAFKRGAIEKLYPGLTSENFEIEAEIFLRSKKLGLNVTEVPSIELRRKNGKSNLKAIQDGFLILRTILREFIHPD
jgi:glycosyltransferase involved in cell wall biosynthesis